MTRTYNTEETPFGQVIWYEENGYRYSFNADPANSDYQRYLRHLAGEDESGTLS